MEPYTIYLFTIRADHETKQYLLFTKRKDHETIHYEFIYY